MLIPATLLDVVRGKLQKANGHLVVVTRYYPRFIKRVWINEYISDLAPHKELLMDFKAAEKELGHDEAFDEIDYVNRFELSVVGMLELERLLELSNDKDVYLLCHCSLNQRCHREILIDIARDLSNQKMISSAAVTRISSPEVI